MDEFLARIVRGNTSGGDSSSSSSSSSAEHSSGSGGGGGVGDGNAVSDAEDQDYFLSVLARARLLTPADVSATPPDILMHLFEGESAQHAPTLEVVQRWRSTAQQLLIDEPWLQDCRAALA